MKQSLFIFSCGAIFYPSLELLWRGYTHYSMAIAGGVCMLLIDFVCCKKLSHKGNIAKCFAGCLIITSIELVTGLIVNKIFMFEIWNYSDLPLNFLGQICLPFSLVWFLLTLPAMQICIIIGKWCNNQKVNDSITENITENVNEF